MTLCKKLTMTLLFSCLLHSYCGGMEQASQSEEKYKAVNKIVHPADGLYLEAIKQLQFYLENSQSLDPLSSAVNQLDLASKEGHSRSERLLPFVTTYLQTASGKLEETPDYVAALCAIHFSAGYLEDGFRTLLSLEKDKYPNMITLIDQILSQGSISIHLYFFEKFTTLRQDRPLWQNEIPQITQTILESFIFSDILTDGNFEIQPHTQADIGKIYIEASLNSPHNKSSSILDPRLKEVSKIMPGKREIYFCTGVTFCISAAKQNDQDAYETLAKALRETREYDAFFEQLFPSFKRGDEQAQELFNRIVFQDNHAFVGFYDYTKKIVASSSNPREIRAVSDRVINNFEHDVKSQKPADTRPSIVSLSSVAKDLTDKTTKQGVHGGDTLKSLEEARISPEEDKEQKEYDDAMKLFYTKPRDSLMLLLDVSEPRRNLKAYEKLNLIRLSDGYTNPQIVQENDYGRLLKECEKNKAKEWFDSFEQLFAKKTKNYNFTDQEIHVAAVDLEKAYRYENLAAIEYVKKLKKLNCYKNPQTATAKTPRDWLAIKFADLSGMSAAVNGTHTEKPSKQKPMVQSAPQKMETQKKNKINHNGKVHTAGDIPKISSPVTVLPVISSSKENDPREQKSKGAINSIKIQRNALPQIQLHPESAPTPVVEISPIIEEKNIINTHSHTLLHSKKRDNKESDKKKDVEITPTLMLTNDQLPTESKVEAVVPSESKIKHPFERRVHSKKALMEIQPKPSRRRLERHSSSSQSIEDVPVIKENSVSDHSTSTEAASTKPKERKSIHRTQSLISIPSAKTPYRKKELTLQETLNNESKPRKTILRTLSLNNISLGNDSEESSVKKEKEKKKNKSPITKTSLKDHLNPKKKLERRDSEKKLALSVNEEASDYSSSEISTSDKPLVDLFKQDGKRDENLKHLKKLFNNRDLIKASDIKLNRSIVVRVLRELGPKGKKIITWNFETPGNKNISIIRADIIRTSEHSKTQELPTLNIHLHSRQGKWYEDANIKDHFIKFICACDPSVKALVVGIQKNNTNS